MAVRATTTPSRSGSTRRPRQAAARAYEAHVDADDPPDAADTPGERADLPEFGCGLRRLLFARTSDVLAATTQMLVQEALGRWLADHLTVRAVNVIPPARSPAENQLRHPGDLRAGRDQRRQRKWT